MSQSYQLALIKSTDFIRIYIILLELICAYVAYQVLYNFTFACSCFHHHMQDTEQIHRHKTPSYPLLPYSPALLALF